MIVTAIYYAGIEKPEIHSGKDADDVFDAINKAGARGAGWAITRVLSDGSMRIYVLANIATVQYTNLKEGV